MTAHEPEHNSTQPDAKPAAQYIRMSTEHQQYSTQNQADTIREYAQKRGFRIIKTYADEGRSGLRIEGRCALKQMIDDAKSGNAGYEAIATSDDEGIQKALHEAYEQNLLRGKKLLRVREFIEKRRVDSGTKGDAAKEGDPGSLSTHKMLRAYRDETARQQAVVKQAHLCQRQLLYVVAAMKRLFTDANFINLLRAESLDSLPQYLAEKVL